MDARKRLIIIKGKDQTDSVASFQFHDGKCEVVYTSAPNKSYSFQRSNVEILPLQKKIDPARVIVTANGQAISGIDEILDFGGYYRIVRNGKRDLSFRRMSLKIQLFENQRIRTAWDEEKEEWYFSIVDVVGVLTDSVDPTAYWRKLKQRLKAEGNETVTNCHGLKMTAHDGKKRLTDVADTKQLLRIIQSIPSPKAEPFKLWLAQVGRERIEETIDPELTIERALETYLKKGYTREWINQRLQAIQVRKELTDEWDARGVQKGVEYAILTDEISRAWSGMSTQQYKNLKGLKKENLRDNMTTLELVLNMLAEATTTEISKQKAPATPSENIDVARAGGKVAGDARKAIETQTGVPVITSKNAAQLSEVVTNLLEDAGNKEK